MYLYIYICRPQPLGRSHDLHVFSIALFLRHRLDRSQDGIVQLVLTPRLSSWPPRCLLYYFILFEVVSFVLVLIRPVSYDTYVAFCHVRNGNSTDFETDGVSECRKIHIHPPLLVVFKAVPSSRSLTTLDNLRIRYQGSSWEKQAHMHRYSAAYQVAGSRYQRPRQQLCPSQAPTPPPPPD